MGGFKKNTKAARVYKKFSLSWQQDIYESNKSSWTKEDDIDLLFINRLLDKKSRTKKTIPHITLKTKDKTFHITIGELTAKTVEVKAKNEDMAWDKVKNDGYWEYEQIGDDKCIEWNFANSEEVKEG